MSKSPTGSRRPSDPWQTAETAFKKATTKPAEAAPKKPNIPGVKETVTLRIDRDVLDFFHENGPGWQDRINEAPRKAAGKSSFTTCSGGYAEALLPSPALALRVFSTWEGLHHGCLDQARE